MRISGVYWGAACLACMRRLEDLDADALATFVAATARPGGGHGGAERHDPHLLHTLSAVQVAALVGRMDAVDAGAVMSFVASLQRPDGSFAGDAGGEIDTRFS